MFKSFNYFDNFTQAFSSEPSKASTKYKYLNTNSITSSSAVAETSYEWIFRGSDALPASVFKKDFLMGEESSPPHSPEIEVKTKLKCVLVGDGAVGKTSLVVSYTTNGYPTEYVPTAFDNYNVQVTVDNQPLSVQLCDTAGQDDFDSLRPLCYPSTDVFLVCFSVVSPASFHNIREKWLPELQSHQPHAPFILVGTQSDLRSDVKVLIELAQYREQPVSESSARRLAQATGAVAYIESSALTQRNLKDVFDQAIITALASRKAPPLPPPPPSFRSSLKRASSRTKRSASATIREEPRTDAHHAHALLELPVSAPHKHGWNRFCCVS